MDQPKPTESEICSLNDCLKTSLNQWQVGPWQVCPHNLSCDAKIVQRRQVFCSENHQSRRIRSPNLCNIAEKPIDSRPCKLPDSCDQNTNNSQSWNVSEWSQVIFLAKIFVFIII